MLEKPIILNYRLTINLSNGSGLVLNPDNSALVKLSPGLPALMSLFADRAETASRWISVIGLWPLDGGSLSVNHRSVPSTTSLYPSHCYPVLAACLASVGRIQVGIRRQFCADNHINEFATSRKLETGGFVARCYCPILNYRADTFAPLHVTSSIQTINMASASPSINPNCSVGCNRLDTVRPTHHFEYNNKMDVARLAVDRSIWLFVSMANLLEGHNQPRLVDSSDLGSF